MKEQEEKTKKNSHIDKIKRKPHEEHPAAEHDASSTDDIPNDADVVASAATLEAGSDAHWPISIIGAFVGMLIGTLPASIWALIFGFSFTPLYLLVPLCIYFGIRLFRGVDGKRGLILIIIFSLIGLYLTALSCQATVDVVRFKMSILNLPLVTIAMIGKSGVLPSPAFSSANVFPVVFTAIGVMLTYEPLRKLKGSSENNHQNENTDIKTDNA